MVGFNMFQRFKEIKDLAILFLRVFGGRFAGLNARPFGRRRKNKNTCRRGFDAERSFFNVVGWTCPFALFLPKYPRKVDNIGQPFTLFWRIGFSTKHISYKS